MDTEARPVGNDMWLLADLLDRKVGAIVQTSMVFLIEDDQPSILEGIVRGPHKMLDDTMSAAEKETGGQRRQVGSRSGRQRGTRRRRRAPEPPPAG